MDQEEICKERQKIADDMIKATNRFVKATKSFDQAQVNYSLRTQELQKKCKHTDVSAHRINCLACGKRLVGPDL